MTVLELMAQLKGMPPNALVMRKGELGVMQPLEFAGLMMVERTHYQGQDDRPNDSRAWFEEGVLTDRIRKIETRETEQAVLLKRQGDDQ